MRESRLSGIGRRRCQYADQQAGDVSGAAELQHSDISNHGAPMPEANQPSAGGTERHDIPHSNVSSQSVAIHESSLESSQSSQSSLANDWSSAHQSDPPRETALYRAGTFANRSEDPITPRSASVTNFSTPSAANTGITSDGGINGEQSHPGASAASSSSGGEKSLAEAEASVAGTSEAATIATVPGEAAAVVRAAIDKVEVGAADGVPGGEGVGVQLQQAQGQLQAQLQEQLQSLENLLSLLGLGVASAANSRGSAEPGEEWGDGGSGTADWGGGREERARRKREELAMARAASRLKRKNIGKMDYDARNNGPGSGGSSGAMGDSGWSDSSSDKDAALGFTGTGSQPLSSRPLENRSKQYQDDPASHQSSPLASPTSSVSSSASSSFASPTGAEAGGAERKVLERAVVEMALLQEVSRGGIEGSTLEEEWGELRQAVSQDPQLSRLYNEYARDALLAREERRRLEAGGGRWKVDARGRRIRKRRRGRKAEAEGEEGMSSKARTEERLRRWRAGVVAAATQSTVVEVATMVVLTVLPIAAGAYVYVNVQEWLKAVAPQPAVVEKEPWWMLFGPAASAAGTVFGMAGLGFAAKTAAAAPVAVAVVPQMDALWRSFGGASLVALYWRTLVFGKTFRSIEWDLEAYDAPNGNMKSITIRVPSLVSLTPPLLTTPLPEQCLDIQCFLVLPPLSLCLTRLHPPCDSSPLVWQNAVRTKIALANGLAGASEVQQLALWIPNSGDFVVSASLHHLPPSSTHCVASAPLLVSFTVCMFLPLCLQLA
ncbi:unnamed protein product [Closterium sp. Yama58-4]|nr:unnamed protein product [Closterium sp. Yama58-4]